MVKGLPADWGACSRTVPLDDTPVALACRKDIIAVGLHFGDIVTLDAITGACLSILSGHNDGANALAFSSDGTHLVSGSRDGTVKLWNVQTGVVVKTILGKARSVSISPDSTVIA